MSKLKDVFCIYEYDMPVSTSPRHGARDKPEVDYVLDQFRKCFDELDERWISSRSMSQSNSLTAHQKRNKSVNSQLERSTRYSKNRFANQSQ